MDIGVLSYLKTLDGFKKHKPIIALSTEVFQSYYDYYIINGFVLIVCVQDEFRQPDTPAIFSLAMINPDAIKGIFVDEVLGADITKATSVASGDFANAVKEIMDKTAKGTYNNNIPFTSLKLAVEDRVFSVNDTFTVNGDLFSVCNVMYDANKFANPGKQGEVYTNTRFISEFSKIESITVPFNGVFKTGMKDYIDDNIKNMIIQYLDNLHILHGRAWRRNTSYHKGEYIFVDINTVDANDAVTGTERKYYVSKVEGNYSVPTESDTWLEITDPDPSISKE